MHGKYIAVLLLFGTIVFQLTAQVRVAGYVFDGQDGERLIGATVYEPATRKGTSTDNSGYFSYVAGGRQIVVSFIGFQPLTVNFSSDTVLFVHLERGALLDEITVYGEQERRFNVSTLSKQEMMSIPALGGKPDVLKSLQLMPGIQSQQEGTSHISVRGGAPGENLYLIDNVPLIYVNHLGGFTSVFNPDMINNIEVFKGGFPAKYGGKLSSIVSITQREGDKSKLKGALSYGLSDVSGVVEGPLFNDRSSFIVTGRKTLTDPLMMLVSNLSQGGDFIVGYGFHDVNAKLSWRPDSKNSFFVNIYQGDDYLFFLSKTSGKNAEKSRVSNLWGNWLASARWNRVITPRLSADNTFSLTRYRLKVAHFFNAFMPDDTIHFESESFSAVQDISLRSDFQYRVSNSWLVEFGTKQSYFRHIPNRTIQNGLVGDAFTETINSYEPSAYLSNNIKLWNFAHIDAGGRLVAYLAPDFSDLVFEPRLLLNLFVTPKNTLNFTYQRVNQFSHLLFTSGSIMNNEIWVPVGKGIGPSNSTQFSVGWKGGFFDGLVETELTLYSKQMGNLMMYKEGYSNLMGDGGWRKKIEPHGSGESRGAEVLVKKTRGELTGFAAYTWSKTTRTFPAINRGDTFLFDFDRPHSLAFHLNYSLSEKWSLNAAWVYHTGQPFTPVIGKQMTPVEILPGEVVYDETLVYGRRNSERMIDYHRLDLGASCKIINKRGNKAEWTFSVYNAYNRLNANSYHYSKDEYWSFSGEDRPDGFYKVSFFPIIPSISYRVYFE